MTDEIKNWLLSLDSPSLAVRAWWRARDQCAVDWLRANAETIIHERLTVHEACWRWGLVDSVIATRASFMRAKRIVFPNGWHRGRPIMTDDELDVPGQIKLGFDGEPNPTKEFRT